MAVNRCKPNHTGFGSIIITGNLSILNYLMYGNFEEKTNFITGVKELCLDCDRLIAEKDQTNYLTVT